LAIRLVVSNTSCDLGDKDREACEILAKIIRIGYPQFAWRELETEAGENYAAFHNPTLNLTDHLTRDLLGWRVDRQEVDEPVLCHTEGHTYARGAIGAVAHSFWEQWQCQLQEAVSLKAWFWERSPKQFVGASSWGMSAIDSEAMEVFTRMLALRYAGVARNESVKETGEPYVLFTTPDVAECMRLIHTEEGWVVQCEGVEGDVLWSSSGHAQARDALGAGAHCLCQGWQSQLNEVAKLVGWFWEPAARAAAGSSAAPTPPRSEPPSSWQERLQSFQPYAFGAGSAFSAFGVRFLLDPLLENYSPFMAFIPAVVASSYFVGRRPALLTVALGLLLGNVFFSVPRGAVTMNASDIAEGLMYLLSASTVVWLWPVGERLKKWLPKPQADAGYNVMILKRAA
jgi:Domain of unknown function (DUF4118)